MGDLQLSQGKTSEAISSFEKAARANPRSVLAANELGVALFTSNQLPEAEDQFKKTLAIEPSYTDARFNLAGAEASNHQLDAAANDYKVVLAERPENTKAREHLAAVMILWGDELAKSGNDMEAIARYREAASHTPDDIQVH